MVCKVSVNFYHQGPLLNAVLPMDKEQEVSYWTTWLVMGQRSLSLAVGTMESTATTVVTLKMLESLVHVRK